MFVYLLAILFVNITVELRTLIFFFVITIEQRHFPVVLNTIFMKSAKYCFADVKVNETNS